MLITSSNKIIGNANIQCSIGFVGQYINKVALHIFKLFYWIPDQVGNDKYKMSFPQKWNLYNKLNLNKQIVTADYQSKSPTNN